jgi:hypothetical protein
MGYWEWLGLQPDERQPGLLSSPLSRLSHLLAKFTPFGLAGFPSHYSAAVIVTVMAFDFTTVLVAESFLLSCIV